jgi:hypothetical protein
MAQRMHNNFPFQRNYGLEAITAVSFTLSSFEFELAYTCVTLYIRLFLQKLV